MFRVWIKEHKLPIGAETKETVEQIKEVYGEENVVLVEEINE